MFRPADFVAASRITRFWRGGRIEQGVSGPTWAARSVSGRLTTGRLCLIMLSLGLLTGGHRCLAQSQPTVSLFNNLLPATPVDPYTGGTTVGVKVWSTQAGTISGIRFYRGARSPLGYVAYLYAAGSKVLGSVTMQSETGPIPGWQQAIFAAPVPIAANTTYVAAYYAPNGGYSRTWYGLSQTLWSGPLTASAGSLIGGNGVWVRGNAYPVYDFLHGNFFVDVAFTPAQPYLSIVVDPANPILPSTTLRGAVVAKITANWSDGSPFTGTLSFGAPNFSHGGVYALDSSNNLIVNPNGPGVGSAGKTSYVTIVATQ